ncbi:MAG: diaminopimelate decarboxylase [Planctomycetota bacterium]|nr:MAG: diaminopimelate decarboxylase [Planctomycetota bacterium]
MDHFQYRDGALWCEQTPVARIAEAVGTPAFIYSAATLRDHYCRLAVGFAPLRPIICYSIKSCANLHVCRLLRELGAGFDVVSGGELARALEAGGDPAKIVFAGVGKTDDEIRAGIEAGIGWFNIESEAELENLSAISAKLGRSVRAALRVNPDVDPKTHRYTSTGKKETKFGVDLERARRVFETFGRDAHVRLTGIHLHIGSPVNDVSSYVSAVTKATRLIDVLRAAGFTLDMLDIGGGFGAHYRGSEAPDAQAYAKAIVPLVEPYVAQGGLQVVIEPGRSISGNAGILLSRVLYRKRGGEREFLIIDAGMTELIRPALYEAYHFMWPVAPAAGFVPEPRGESARADGMVLYDVVGPICESGDFLAKERRLPPMERGDLLAVFTAGAYGMVMASNYNSRGRPPEVLVEGDSWRVIRRRESYDDLVGLERSTPNG